MNLSKSAEIQNREYRHGLVNAQIEIDLPLQIRALRKQLVGTQPELSRLTGMKQSRISNMEKPGRVHFSLETLQRLAEAFDVALIVRFAPFTELLDWTNKFDPDNFRVPSFTEETQVRPAPERSENVREKQQSAVTFGLRPSPEELAWFEPLWRAANEQLRASIGRYTGYQMGLGNPYEDTSQSSVPGKRQVRKKGELIEMPKRSDATQVKRRNYGRREQRTEHRPTRQVATGSY